MKKHIHKNGKTRTFCVRCTLITIGFPIEHFIWEKLPMFRTLAGFLGL